MSTARSFAVAYGLQVGRSRGDLKPSLDAGHGAAIDWNNLRACGRAFFVRPSYSVQGEEIPYFVSTAVAPQWEVTLCGSHADPSLRVSVSTAGTRVTLVDGRLVFPVSGSGSEFSITPIRPNEGGRELFTLPEEAVSLVAQASGARVAEIPSLMGRGRADGALFLPSTARWKLTLDREVGVVGVEDNAVRHTRNVWVGIGRDLQQQVLVPADVQPSYVTWRWLAVDSAGIEIEPPRTDSARVSVVHPIEFVEVRFARS